MANIFNLFGEISELHKGKKKYVGLIFTFPLFYINIILNYWFMLTALIL